MSNNGQRICFFALFVCLFSTVISLGDVIKGPIEVCNREFLNISCSIGEVILIETALYGRMRVGRCVHQSLGYVDCRTDVVNHVEMWCSGLQRCLVKVPDDALYETKPCPPDTTSYLETTYRCLRVDGIGGEKDAALFPGQSPPRRQSTRVASAAEQCRAHRRGILRNATSAGPEGGYVSGVMHLTADIGDADMDDDVIGTEGCPWVIESRQGQRINLTLLDFVRRKVPAQQQSHHYRNGVQGDGNCIEIAKIRDGDRTKTITTCLGGPQPNRRQRHVYLSTNPSIELTILMRSNEIAEGPFIFHYAAVGCPALVASPHSTVQLSTNAGQLYIAVGDTAIIRCNSTSTSWSLTCTANNSWTTTTGPHRHQLTQQQLFDDCPSMTAVSASAGTARGAKGKRGPWSGLDGLLSTDESLPYGVFLAVALGVALGVFLGGFFLALIAINRRRHSNSSANATVNHYDFNEIALSQHEMFDVHSDAYATSTGARTQPRLAMTSDIRAIHKLLDGNESKPCVYHASQFGAGVAPCRMQHTTIDRSVGGTLADHYGTSSVRGLTLLSASAADDNDDDIMRTTSSSVPTAIRYYDL